MKALETNRLILREFTQEDFVDFYGYAQNEKVGPMAGWKPHTNVEESHKILDSFIENREVWAIENKANHRVIGSIGLHVDRKRDYPNVKMLGYVLSEAYWGKGLMLEAVYAILNHGFNELNLDLISVYHYSFNRQSESVIKNAGFKYEGTQRLSTIRFDGVVLDSVLYSMTRNEYNAI